MKIPTNTSLILSGEDVRKIVMHFGLNPIMDDLIDRMEDAIINFDRNETIIPVRSGFNYEKPFPGLIEWMPLYQKGQEVIIKVVGYHPLNPESHNLPTIVSTIYSYDITTGHLLGIIDGVFLTALRTGAASAIASRAMARPASSVLGLIGCGAQAVTQVHAISRIFDIKRILIFDINAETENSFAERCSVLELDCEVVKAGMEDIIRESDIVITATSVDVGKGPLFQDLETKPHLHINAVGSDFPGKVELPVELLKRSFVCPDFTEQAINEGECQQLEKEQIGPDLVTVVNDPVKYKSVKNRLSVFDSTGWPLEDQIVMDLFLEYAKELGLGQEIDIELIPKDAKNPYHFMGQLVASPTPRRG